MKLLVVAIAGLCVAAAQLRLETGAGAESSGAATARLERDTELRARRARAWLLSEWHAVGAALPTTDLGWLVAALSASAPSDPSVVTPLALELQARAAALDARAPAAQEAWALLLASRRAPARTAKGVNLAERESPAERVNPAERVDPREGLAAYDARLLQFVRPSSAVLAGGSPSATSGRYSAALDFLRTTRATEAAGELARTGPPGALELSLLAGAWVTSRGVLTEVLAQSDARWGDLLARLGAAPTGGDARALLLAATVLAEHRSPYVLLRGALCYWPDELQRALMALWLEGPGAFAARAGGPPDRVATAAVSLALDVLEPWLRIDPDELSRAAASNPKQVAELSLACESCHARLNPGLHRQWSLSAHAANGVGCAECHGTNHSLIFREEGRVPPSACATCHAQAALQFARSTHARAEQSLHDSALFAATPVESRAACIACHRIGLRHTNGESGSCNYCHSGHDFSAAAAREPEACTTCHVGEDYPQEEAYRLSKHGALYYTHRDATLAPTCATCHNPRGTHDDSFGLGLGSRGVGKTLAGAPLPIAMPVLSQLEHDAARTEMIGVCADCHSTRFARASLLEADRVKLDCDELLGRGRALLEGLVQGGWIERPEGGLELGGDQVLTPPSVAGGALLDRFYRMWRFVGPQTWKGAYHNSPSVANHHSLPGLARELELLEAEARALSETAASTARTAARTRGDSGGDQSGGDR